MHADGDIADRLAGFAGWDEQVSRGQRMGDCKCVSEERLRRIVREELRFLVMEMQEISDRRGGLMFGAIPGDAKFPTRIEIDEALEELSAPERGNL
jgi:hypothetical protein